VGSRPEPSSLVEVRLIAFPMRAFQEAREHNEGLTREFKLISLGDPHRSDVPHRLVQLAEDLDRRFGSFGAGAESELALAEAEGLEQLDLAFHVPAEVAEASAEFNALLDEADRYCSAGQHLLTLVSPPEALAFRRWFLDEFVRQIGGQAPIPWPEYRSAAAIPDEGPTASD
jgi:hypothetical protein